MSASSSLVNVWTMESVASLRCFDLSLLQRESINVSPRELRQYLQAAPAEAGHHDAVFLLTGDLEWLRSSAASLMLGWLGNRARLFVDQSSLLAPLVDVLVRQGWFFVVHQPSLIENQWLTPSGLVPPNFNQSRVLTDGSSEEPRSLAFFTPLPPQKTGLAAYAAQLLPLLAEHYRITVVTDCHDVLRPAGVHEVLTTHEYQERSSNFERVVYSIGNSPLNLRAISQCVANPGLLLLHDFYLSHALLHPDADDLIGADAAWRIYQSHGYCASVAMQESEDSLSDAALWSYPCSLPLLRASAGVVVHGNQPLRLAEEIFPRLELSGWKIIPHLKSLPSNDSGAKVEVECRAVRSQLGISPEAFVIASFGFLGPAKLSALILDGFLESPLAAEESVVLVFAGSAEGQEALLRSMRDQIQTARSQGRLKAEIRFSGWLDDGTYHQYLLASNLAIQLRSRSRGETSGTVLDCLAHGIPLILNRHGSLADVPDECCFGLPEHCDAKDIQKALFELYQSPQRRLEISRNGRALIGDDHNPAHCVTAYLEAVERSHAWMQRRREIALVVSSAIAEQGLNLVDVANGLARLFPPVSGLRQLFVDVTALAQQDLGSGVQRVVRELVLRLLRRPPVGVRVEPVVALEDESGYRYAHAFTRRLLGLRPVAWVERPIHPCAGDCFLGIDLHHAGVVRQAPYFQVLRALGVDVRFVVHDLLPCQLPECFPPGAAEWHQRWLDVVTAVDGALCVSRSVASDLQAWISARASCLQPFPSYRIDWFHHGCDFGPALREADPSLNPLPKDCRGPILLMVGTLEPRKGYADVLAAATKLWEEGEQFVLVIAGREGWLDLPRSQRRSIPDLVDALTRHPQLGRRLFWFDRLGDAPLKSLYQRADGLIAASYGEGFGIPLIEAASYGLSLLVRDIAVFREVTDGRAAFFREKATTAELAGSMRLFLSALHRGGPRAQGSSPLTVQSWEESADQVVRALGLEPGPQLPALLDQSNEVSDPAMGASGRPPRSWRLRSRTWLKNSLRQVGLFSAAKRLVLRGRRLRQHWRSGHLSSLRSQAASPRSGGEPVSGVLLETAGGWYALLKAMQSRV